MLAGEPPYAGADGAGDDGASGSPAARRACGSCGRGARAGEQAIRTALAPVAGRPVRDRGAVRRGRWRRRRRARHGGQTPASDRPAPRRRLRGQARRGVPVAARTLVLGFLIGLGVLFAWRRSHGEALPERGSWPCSHSRTSATPAEEYFADGITDAVRGKLDRPAWTRGIAGRSSSQYKHTDKALTQIAQELGVEPPGDGEGALGEGGGRQPAGAGESRAGAGDAGGSPRPSGSNVRRRAHRRVPGPGEVAAGWPRTRRGARRQHSPGAGDPTDAEPGRLRSLPARRGRGARPGAARSRVVASRHPGVRAGLALDSNFALAWAQLAMARSFLYANAGPTPALKLQTRAAADRAVALAPGRPHR